MNGMGFFCSFSFLILLVMGLNADDANDAD